MKYLLLAALLVGFFYPAIGVGELEFIQFNDAIHSQDNERIREILQENPSFVNKIMFTLNNIENEYKSLYLEKRKDFSNLDKITVGSRWTPLSWIVFYNNQNLFTEFMKKSANVNYLDFYQRNALHVASKWSGKEIIEFLLVSGAKLNQQDFRGDTPMHSLVRRDLISQQDKIELLKLFFENGGVFKRNKEGVNILDILIKRNEIVTAVYLIKKFPRLLNSRGPRGNNPLHWASGSSNLSTFSLLSRSGISINSKNHQGWRPIHWAIQNNNLEILRAISDFEKVELNAKDNLGETALHKAVLSDKLNHAELLLRKRLTIDINAQNKEGNTPLHLAVLQNKVNFVKLLLQYFANTNLKNKKNKTPLDLARSKEVVELLKRKAN